MIKVSKEITIHQPEHAVYLGFLLKAANAEELIILDDVQFEKNYFQNRNRIRVPFGADWVTAPVEKHNHKPISEIQISMDASWKKSYLGKIMVNYRKAPYFREYYSAIQDLIMHSNNSLFDLNMSILTFLFKNFEIKTPMVFSSSLGYDSSLLRTDRILEICKLTNATSYLSGISGKDYLILDGFKENNIDVKFFEFIPKPYLQQFEPFFANLSAFDFLLNCGPKNWREL